MSNQAHAANSGRRLLVIIFLAAAGLLAGSMAVTFFIGRQAIVAQHQVVFVHTAGAFAHVGRDHVDPGPAQDRVPSHSGLDRVRPTVTRFRRLDQAKDRKSVV